MTLSQMQKSRFQRSVERQQDNGEPSENASQKKCSNFLHLAYLFVIFFKVRD